MFIEIGTSEKLEGQKSEKVYPWHVSKFQRVFFYKIVNQCNMGSIPYE